MQFTKRKIATFATVILIALSTLVPALAVQSVSADAAGEVCAGIATASGQGCNGSNTTLNNIVANGVNILSVVIGVVAVIMIMVGGFRYITAGGDSGKLGAARSTIMYAIIGLVIVVLAQSIVHFVLHAATSAPTVQHDAQGRVIR